ncbi:MAG TPA: GGDEF domain-containing protein [Desulfobacteraceae bacterium]|nr:GGDEF domain-containing protein [Desulfobacteraceae bacterium]
MDVSITELEKIFVQEKKFTEKRLFELFDDAGVPGEICWRTIYRMIFDANLNLNPNVEKTVAKGKLEPVMKLALANAQNRDFSQNSLLLLLNQYNKAFFSVCQGELLGALSEIDDLTNEFQLICNKRQGRVKTLESETLKEVRSDHSVEEKVRVIKEKFKSTIAAFQSDVVKLDQMNNTDHLTRIYNRRYFDEHLSYEAGQAIREKTWLNLLMIDIDDFKQFNDNYGHQIGDQALKTVAKKLRIACDDSARETGMEFSPVRYGGEEFAVIAPAVELQTAAKLAETIRRTIGSYSFVIRGKKGDIKHESIRITISIGVAGFAHNSGVEDGVDDLIKRADMAMYRAKKAGKNRVVTLNHDA